MLTAAEVFAALGVTPHDTADQAWMDAVAAAVTAYVDRLPHIEPSSWDAGTRAGATLLAQRIYSARSAPLGAAGLDVAGGLIRSSTDPEVGRLLRIGRYQSPRVG